MKSLTLQRDVDLHYMIVEAMQEFGSINAGFKQAIQEGRDDACYEPRPQDEERWDHFLDSDDNWWILETRLEHPERCGEACQHCGGHKNCEIEWQFEQIGMGEALGATKAGDGGLRIEPGIYSLRFEHDGESSYVVADQIERDDVQIDAIPGWDS